MAEFESAEPKAGELMLLLLCNNLPYSEVAAVVDELKSNSKGVGTHKRRQLYWDAYGQMSTKVGSMDGKAHCFLKYLASGEEGVDGTVEVVELTKRQKGLVGSIDIHGKKLKAVSYFHQRIIQPFFLWPLCPNPHPSLHFPSLPSPFALVHMQPDADAASKGWCVAFSEEQAGAVWEDLHAAEPCIYISCDGVYVSTRYKRALCKTISGLPKTIKDAEAIVASLAPEAPLKSISFTANAPLSVTGYNTFFVGALDAKVVAALPPSLGVMPTERPNEIYDFFLLRHSQHLLAEAGKMLAQMKVDVAKGLVPIIVASSMKDAGTARKNSLMKKVYVHASKKAFINRCREDGEVEMHVVSGNIDDSDFGQYGGIVFELFYRADLSVFG